MVCHWEGGGGEGCRTNFRGPFKVLLSFGPPKAKRVSLNLIRFDGVTDRRPRHQLPA